MTMSELDLLPPLAAATLLGALLGLERETRSKAAGLRTHMMVALGAASFTLLSFEVVGRSQELDPVRAVQGVVTGIGFLGAGQIIRERARVRGITTAAGIWVVGAVGTACGARMYVLAAATALLAFVTLTGVGLLERTWFRHDES